MEKERLLMEDSRVQNKEQRTKLSNSLGTTLGGHNGSDQRIFPVPQKGE